MVTLTSVVSMAMAKVGFSLVCTGNGGNRYNHVSVYMGPLIRGIMTNVSFSVYGYCGNTGCSDNWKWW